MGEKNAPAYINICIGYRILTLILSTMAYIGMSLYYGDTEIYWGIVSGMVVSCLLSSWIYRRIGDNELWLRIMFVIEAFAYGIFTLMSGGLSSPYLWYQMSCILLMIVLERSCGVTLLASFWGLICAIAGTIKNGLSYQELNIALGMLIVIGGFYVLRFYIRYIDDQKRILLNLNFNLEKEKERSEYAFQQLTGLYETFHLFAMTNPEKIIRELSVLLRRTIAPSGCILIKYDTGGLPERSEVCDIDEGLATKMVAELNLQKSKDRFKHIGKEKFLLNSGGGIYEAKIIGEATGSRGIFIRQIIDEGQENEKFYWDLIEIIFSNLDIHNQLERFITMDEQNRIANEIHDTVIQKLFGIVCTLKVLETSLQDRSKEELKEQMTALKRSVEITMAELRESIYGRTFNDTIKTFIGAMNLYMEEAQHLSGTNISMTLDEDSDYMTTAQKIAVYRIACEAVNNAIRHGNARNIIIKLKLNAERIELQIKDDGKGLMKKKGVFQEGNGLKNMRNIAALLKGSLLMESEAGEGTNICLNLPR